MPEDMLRQTDSLSRLFEEFSKKAAKASLWITSTFCTKNTFIHEKEPNMQTDAPRICTWPASGGGREDLIHEHEPNMPRDACPKDSWPAFGAERGDCCCRASNSELCTGKQCFGGEKCIACDHHNDATGSESDNTPQGTATEDIIRAVWPRRQTQKNTTPGTLPDQNAIHLHHGNYLSSSGFQNDVLSLATKSKTWRAQTILMSALKLEQTHYINAFRGHVWPLAQDQRAHHVLILLVENIDETLASFIADELEIHGIDAANNKYACKILCKMVEQCWHGEASRALLEEVSQTKHAWRECQFAKYVLQTLLQSGTTVQRQQVIRALIDDFKLPGASSDYQGSDAHRVLMHPKNTVESEGIYVVVEALATCDVSVLPLAEKMAEDLPLLRGLCQRKFGSVLLKNLFAFEPEQPLMDREWLQRFRTSLAALLDELFDKVDSKCNLCEEAKRCPMCAKDIKTLNEIVKVRWTERR